MGATGNPSTDAAPAEQPQRIASKDAGGIAAAVDDDHLDAPRESLLDFLRNSPLAEAMAEGKRDLARARDGIRDFPR
jgi:hypothetical protein